MSVQLLKPVVLMGANASGNTGLALELARRLGGEVLSADSRQVYRLMEAGTAKPRGAWTDTPDGKFYLVDGVPYHLVDTLDPRASWDAGSFVREAKKLVPGIWKRGKVPIMAGGTGMYVQAYWNGLDELPPSDPTIRQQLTALAESGGKLALYSELQQLDPEAARRIPPGNVQRVMRAIEITRAAGRPASQLWTGRFFHSLPVHDGKFVFLKWSKELLTERVKRRTMDNFEAWAEETRELLRLGYAEDCPGLKTLGYPQMLDYLAGRLEKQDAIRQIVAASMSYAKRQNTWFGRYRNVLRIELEKPEDYDAGALAERIINS